MGNKGDFFFHIKIDLQIWEFYPTPAQSNLASALCEHRIVIGSCGDNNVLQRASKYTVKNESVTENAKVGGFV